ncbi:MAG TPA: hypothetical protein VIM12_20195 [Noviherbaspirillum sp.]|jgi:hypothetical protein|uniref:hypothetical protein n=1 Tax=Noviherbaspirillum sp. TaxID=1926288 RepID=UPI002F92BF1F
MHIKLGVPFLLIACTSALSAEPGYPRDGRESVRAILLQNAIERDSRGEPPAMDLDRRRGGDSLFPDAGTATGSQVQEGNNPSAESVRRLRSLSPEERRTLRRQIDEVGHDIYSPRR